MALLSFGKYFIRFDIKTKIEYHMVVLDTQAQLSIGHWTKLRKKQSFLNYKMYSHWVLQEISIVYEISKVFLTFFNTFAAKVSMGRGFPI